MISILVLFLLLGVATPRHVSFYDNENVQEPIISGSQEHRICAELCMSGLGGEPCGSSCWAITPQGLPTTNDQSVGHLSPPSNYTRKDVCPVLCANRLGYPLCNCDTTDWNRPFFKVNYAQICGIYCEKYNYEIFGCFSCQRYQHKYNKFISFESRALSYSWNEWCQQMCQEGDGGSACYCDLLPMGLHN